MDDMVKSLEEYAVDKMKILSKEIKPYLRIEDTVIYNPKLTMKMDSAMVLGHIRGQMDTLGAILKHIRSKN